MDYMTAKEIADACTPKLTKSRIIQLIRGGEIQGEKVKGPFGVSYWRVPTTEAWRFIRAYKKND